MPRLTQIRGQPGAVEVLRRAAASGRLASAYLFAGPEGCGKATTARALCAALNCHSEPGEGCHECESCHKLDAELHPDLIRLEPDGAMIKIGQVRAVEEALSFPPHEARCRVVVIDGADRLNDNAANALLKSVEEPRPGTLFVLVSSAPQAVAPTLISRCQRVRFGPLPESELLALLGERCEAPADQLEAAAAMAQGSARRALELVSGDRIAALTEMVEQLLRAVESGRVVPAFDAAAACGKERGPLEEALDLLKLRLRDSLLGASGDSGAARQIVRRIRAVNEAQAAIRGNVSVALALETLVLGLQMG